LQGKLASSHIAQAASASITFDGNKNIYPEEQQYLATMHE